MAVRRSTRRLPRRLGVLAALAALLALVAGVFPAAAAGGSATAAAPTQLDRGNPSPVKPAIVLVHGAFADASGSNDVTEKLPRKGYPVYAFANPLRSVSGDAEYLRLFLSTISGPVVVVGHSYGGFVVTNGATGPPVNVPRPSRCSSRRPGHPRGGRSRPGTWWRPTITPSRRKPNA
jgi:pimeloyl-ACP methyl ester carboxylesterase